MKLFMEADETQMWDAVENHNLEIDRESLESMRIHKTRPIRTFFGKDWNGGKSGFKRGLLSNNGKLFLVLAELAKLDKTDAQIAKATGMCRKTVKKARMIFEMASGKVAKCLCGKPINHRGACGFRVRFSKPHIQSHEAYKARLNAKKIKLLRELEQVEADIKHEQENPFEYVARLSRYHHTVKSQSPAQKARKLFHL